ncbi:MAG: serine/threonine protein kinase, partial [Thermoanaerobaculia bacterium]|nr:serine/threonine protein kinase [Thermoanaerobaculia bacterium]
MLREARAASALDHPNICTVYEIGEGEDGRPFIAMAFCDGEDIQAKIDRGPLAIETALEIAIQVAQGLEAAHQAGIVHRDVKPGNVLVSERGVVKLVDFGTAKVLRAGEASTGEGLSGTPAYMSPEQLEGGTIDARTDVWSLGV